MFRHFALPARSSMSIVSSQSLDKEVVALHPVGNRLARCIRTRPRYLYSGIQKCSSVLAMLLKTTIKTTRGALNRAFVGVAAWVICAAKSAALHSEAVSALLLLIFVEEALYPSGSLRDPGLCCSLLGMWGPRDGSPFWETICPFGRVGHVCDSCVGN
jgi:hypothetical protein